MSATPKSNLESIEAMEDYYSIDILRVRQLSAKRGSSTPLKESLVKCIVLVPKSTNNELTNACNYHNKKVLYVSRSEENVIRRYEQ